MCRHSQVYYVTFEYNGALVRQNAFDEKTPDVPCFVESRGNSKNNNCLTANVDFISGQSLADKDVNDIVESEQVAAVVWLRDPQDRCQRSSSTLSNEDHSTMMRDQSTQVNY